jgi:hypothetical protein
MLELGPNGAIYPITSTIFQRGLVSPDHRRLALVCMALNHQMNRCKTVTESHNLSMDFLHYRGLMIRSLSKDLKVPAKCTSDLVIAGMVILLLIDVRPHLCPRFDVLMLTGAARQFG